MSEITQSTNNFIEMVVKELSKEIVLESLNTYNKNCLNGYQTITFDLCDSTNEADRLIDLRKIATDITKVTRLTLSHCSLTNIPQYISGLFLKALDLSHNSLKYVPSCILNGLKDLERLDLSNNYIQEFETEPQCVAKLRVLNLSSNKLNYLPIWVLTLRSINLVELLYSYNEIGATDHTEYENIIVCNLNTLVLKNCCVHSDNIQFLKSVPGLTNLNLSNDMCVSRNSFGDCEELFYNPAWKDCIEVLHLNKLVISFLPKNMSAFVNLKQLYLSNNDIFWLPDYFTEFNKLEILDVSNNLITRLPINLNNMRSLRVLKAQCNAISSVPEMSGLTNLKVLDLYRNELENFVYNIDQFEWIDLEQNLFVTNIFGNEYVDKKNSFRCNNDDGNRLDGCRTDFNVGETDSDTSSVERYSSFTDNSDVESGHQAYGDFDDENWDVQCKKHPDITTSDEEWQGHFDAPIKKKTLFPKLQKNLDIVFADADE